MAGDRQGAAGMQDILSVETMIEACRKKGGTVWAYGRVSTDAQELERQNLVFQELGIDESHILNEAKSGKDFDRPVFKELMRKVRPNDLIVFRSVDRFGRSLVENEKLRNEIIFVKNVMIAFTDSPMLNRSQEQSSLGYMFSSILYIFQSYFAEVERQAILQRTAEGRQLARKHGVVFGRKPKEIPASFWEMQDALLSRRLSCGKARRALGVNHRTLKKWIRLARKRKMEKLLRERVSLLEGCIKRWERRERCRPDALPESQRPFRDAQREAAEELLGKMREELRRFSAVSGEGGAGLGGGIAYGGAADAGNAYKQRREQDLDAEVGRMEARVAELLEAAGRIMAEMEGAGYALGAERMKEKRGDRESSGARMEDGEAEMEKNEAEAENGEHEVENGLMEREGCAEGEATGSTEKPEGAERVEGSGQIEEDKEMYLMNLDVESYEVKEMEAGKKPFGREDVADSADAGNAGDAGKTENEDSAGTAEKTTERATGDTGEAEGTAGSTGAANVTADGAGVTNRTVDGAETTKETAENAGHSEAAWKPKKPKEAEGAKKAETEQDVENIKRSEIQHPCKISRDCAMLS